MLRSSRVLSDAPHRPSVGQARVQEVLAARLSPPAVAVPMPPRDWLASSSATIPYRRSARIAAQSTVATYMSDGSVIRVPASVTVRPCSLARTNTYADHEYGGGQRSSNTVFEHYTTLCNLLKVANEPNIDSAVKQNRVYDVVRYVELYGHTFLWAHDALRQTVVAKARQLRQHFNTNCVLKGIERQRLYTVLRHVEDLFSD